MLNEERLNDLTLIALKTMVELKSINKYFIVTSSVSGLVMNKFINFSKDNIWELYGNQNYYQNEKGDTISNISNSKNNIKLCYYRPNIITCNDSSFNSIIND